MPDAETAKTAVQPEPRLGSYRLLQQLGSGGMSSVFRAVHVESGHEVAVKVLPRYLAKNPTLLQRFLREAKSAESLEHPNIVSIYDRGNDNGRYYLVLEYVKGGDLHDRVRNYGPLKPADAIRVIRSAAHGLRYAAGRGVIHRDVKPANLLMTTDGQTIKITDLGLALQVEADDERVTRDGTTVGTVDYMSPEQARDSRATSVRSDIYSLGCTFYYLLTGLSPFAGGDVTEKLRRHATEPAPDVRILRPEIPVALALLVRRMMAKDPEGRYADYDQLLAALDALPPSVTEAGDDDLPSLVPLEDEQPADSAFGGGRSSSFLRGATRSETEAETVALPTRPGKSSGSHPSTPHHEPFHGTASRGPRRSPTSVSPTIAPILRQLDEEHEPGLPPPVYGSATLRARRNPIMPYIIPAVLAALVISLAIVGARALWTSLPTSTTVSDGRDKTAPAETGDHPDPDVAIPDTGGEGRTPAPLGSDPS